MSNAWIREQLRITKELVRQAPDLNPPGISLEHWQKLKEKRRYRLYRTTVRHGKPLIWNVDEQDRRGLG